MADLSKRMLFIPLNQIRHNKVSLRDVDRESLGFKELVNSVRQDGVLNAISVRERVVPEDDKKYEVIDGLQRFTASTEVGTGVIETDNDGNPQGHYERTPEGQMIGVIPAQILQKEDEDVLLAQTIANAHRIETKPVEYAKQLVRIMAAQPTLTLTELSGMISKSPQWLDKMLGLLRLDPSLQVLVNEGKIPLTNAYALAKIADKEEQKNWLDRAQTLDAVQFGNQINSRIKEIRDAVRKGNTPGAQVFTPVAHLRTLGELKAGLTDGSLESAVNNTSELNDLPLSAAGLKQAAVVGAKIGLAWAIHLDDLSKKQQENEHNNRQKNAAEQKARREAEKAAKKLEEAKALVGASA